MNNEPQCGNPKHPKGAWHTSSPLPASWQWFERIKQHFRQLRYGCGCKVTMNETQTPPKWWQVIKYNVEVFLFELFGGNRK